MLLPSKGQSMPDKSTLPALCAELRLRADSGVPVVNSRDVAGEFEKEHKNVLRDIDAILHGSHLSHGHSSWFREVRSEHPTVAGRLDRSFDLTRDGLMLLVMGWTGEKALKLKILYIEAFNAMEAALKIEAPTLAEMIITGMREAIAPLAVRFDGQDRVIERVEVRVDEIAADVSFLKGVLVKGRRNLTEPTKRQHVDDISDLGGRCPCCGTATVVKDRTRTAFSDFDHFYQSSHPNPEHTWLICRPCHNDLTTGRVPRTEREKVFGAYQDQRRRLPGRQARLFG